MRIEFGVAVGFTRSNDYPPPYSFNGPPAPKEERLHYMEEGHDNQYQTAIKSVLEVCREYNPLSLFQPTGFGAIIPSPHNFGEQYKTNYIGSANHIFPLKWFVENKPYAPYQAYGEEQWYVYGEQGVLQAYATAIHQVKLSGDTNFAPTINAFASKTRAFYTGNPNRDYKYQILLIITDGIITDMSETKKAILEASKLPLSIIIVGVGDADFSAMKELDGDDKTLEYNGEKAKRDIVQFVPMNEVITKALVVATTPLNKTLKFNNLSLFDQVRVKIALAKLVLAEVPKQVINFMKLYSIVPPQNNYVGGTFPPEASSQYHYKK